MSTDIQHQQSLLIIVRSQAASIRVSEAKAKAKAVKISYHTDQTDQVIVQTSSRLTDIPNIHLCKYLREDHQ